MKRLALLLCAGGVLWSADSRLEAIKADLERVRLEKRPAPPHRGSALFTPIKHRLREWVAAKLPAPGLFTPQVVRELNAELNATGLFEVCKGADCDQQDDTGTLAELEISRIEGFPLDLLVLTGIGFPCGFDQSAYLLRWRSSRWEMRFASERIEYTPERYLPQHGMRVLVARDPDLGDLVLTIGINPACISSWQSLYFRLFRLGPRLGAQQTLLEQDHFAYLGNNSPVPDSLTRRALTVRFAIASIDGGAHTREKVLSYSIAGAQVRRVEPIALTPRDFLEEWVRSPWEEAARWSASRQRATLNIAHRFLHSNGIYGDYLSPQCTPSGNLHPFGLEISAPPNLGTRYFLVRETAPQRYVMERVSTERLPGCPE